MISVVIPTQDRPEDLLTCVRGLAQQIHGSPEFEVIIVDDHSTRSSKEIVERAAQLQNLPVSYFDNPGKRGAAEARNYGASRAVGEIIAFLDDDSFPAHDWIQNVEKLMAKNGCAAITGRIFPVDKKGLFSRARQMRYEIRQDGALRQRLPVLFLAGGNSAVRRRDFDACGGFDTKFAMMHDRDLALKLSSHGLHCFYENSLVVHHRHYKGFVTLLRQSFLSAYYRMLLERKYTDIRPWSFAGYVQSNYEIVCYALRSRTLFLPALGAIITEFIHTLGYCFFWVRLALRIRSESHI